jgi:peptide-methionine (S)-S-oxide reductase
MWFRTPSSLPTPESALPGRAAAIALPERHEVLGTPLAGPYPDGLEVLDLGLGCFWGAERIFWQVPGVFTTLVGYAGGITPNPTYEETCSGMTGHTEAVRVVYDPAQVTAEQLLRLFFESHDPTQGMRQGNDVGTQYRSAVYAHTDAQLAAARAVRDTYQAALTRAGRGAITTEVLPSSSFYPAEAYHQQYLHKVPNGYCGIGGTGVSCPVGTGVTTTS